MPLFLSTHLLTGIGQFTAMAERERKRNFGEYKKEISRNQ
jgi:hypothetical protein